MTAENERSQMAEFLKEHPRLLGALFTIVLLATQAGTVLAGDGEAIAGP